MQAAISAQTKRRGRPSFIATAFELPVPPSANALWFNAPGRGRVKTATYQSWLEEAGWALKEQRVTRIPGTVGLTIIAGLPERSRDLDNLCKPICDLLQGNSIIENDSRICELWARSDKIVPTGCIRVEVRGVLAPALRMSLEGRQQLLGTPERVARLAPEATSSDGRQATR